MIRKNVIRISVSIGIIIFILIGWFVVHNQEKEKIKNPRGCDSQNACVIEDLDEKEDNWNIELTMEDALQKLDDHEDGVYYFGYEDCPWCQDAAPVLKEVAQSHYKKVYYIKIRDDAHNLLYNDEQKERIISYFGDYMETNEDGELTLYVPMVVQMKDGKVQNSHIGTLDSYDPNEREMTKEEIQKLKDIYERFFN